MQRIALNDGAFVPPIKRHVTSSFFSPQNCWQNYVDFHKCIKIKGAGYAPCKQFLKTYLSLCPNMWPAVASRWHALSPGAL